MSQLIAQQLGWRFFLTRLCLTNISFSGVFDQLAKEYEEKYASAKISAKIVTDINPKNSFIKFSNLNILVICQKIFFAKKILKLMI